jgi:glycosyltransferase involved in cell wall biosynthesis
MSANLRVLVMSHTHPLLTTGGAGIAAFQLFSELNAREDVDAWFLGCDREPSSRRDGVAVTQPFGAREYVYSTGGRFDWFRFSNADPLLPRELEGLLTSLLPDIVHMHHYSDFGVEALLTIRRALPDAKIVLTLHEYQAICNHFGQMVKRGDLSLCDRSGLEACHRCFPEIEPSDFFIRERYIKLFFEGVDHFVSPSNFLLERYADWGIERSRLSVIENIVAPALPVPERSSTVADESLAPLRIGYFGQLSRLKGIDVLLECAKIVGKSPQLRVIFDIFGEYRGIPIEFQEQLLAQLRKLGSNVSYRGAYRQDQVDRLMRGMDAVVVPSIWWENSPVVIQEAFRNNRPVLCSDIGGMAEKVRDGLDGFHFPVGSGLELSYLIARLHDDRSILTSLQKTMQRPPPADDIVAEHVALYRELGA